MIFNQKRCLIASKIPPIYVSRNEVLKDGCPVRSVRVVTRKIALNSLDELAKIPCVDPHELEISLDTGVNLKQVSTNVLSKTQLTDYDVAKITSKSKKSESSENV